MKSNRKRSNVGVALLGGTEQRHAVRDGGEQTGQRAKACSLGAYYPTTKRPAAILPTTMRWGSVQHFALG